MPAPFNDPALQTVSLNDFTPGIMRWQRGLYPTSYPLAPPGSAADSYRCIAKPGIGLIPLPTYQLAWSTTATNATNPVCYTLGNMLTLSPRGGVQADIVAAVLLQVGTTASQTTFNILRKNIDFSDTTSATVTYTNSMSGFPINTCQWPTMDYGVFQDPTTHLYARTVIVTDPIACSTSSTGPGIYVTVRGWQTPTPPTNAAESTSISFPLVPNFSYPRIFYHASRVGIFGVGSATTPAGFWSTDNDLYAVSNQLAPTAGGTGPTGTGGANYFTSPNSTQFYAEMGTTACTWGSISTGEFIYILSEGGAVLVFGDLYAPPSTYKLPGVVGPVGIVGRAALTPQGMLYPRIGEGVYVWNGDNTSQTISAQLPDGVFTRTLQQPFQTSQGSFGSQVAWSRWAMFPNNWLYDTDTQSWWQIENAAVINFQVHCTDNNKYLFSSPGIATAAAGQTATLSIYGFNKDNPASSYFWLSNPIPVTTTALVSIQTVEIVASNATTTPATITVTPQVPSGQQPFQQQNGNQTLVYTIPANTVNWRGAMRLGYSDYNIQLAVTANNPGNYAAPTLHELVIGYTTTRTSGVE